MDRKIVCRTNYYNLRNFHVFKAARKNNMEEEYVTYFFHLRTNSCAYLWSPVPRYIKFSACFYEPKQK